MTLNKLCLSLALTGLLFTYGCHKKAENLIQYVNPLIGTGPSTGPNALKHTKGTEGWGQDVPAVSTPFGMTQWTPQTRDTENKWVSPFYFGDQRIQGFRGTHWLGGSCTQDYGSVTIMPVTGYLKTFVRDRASSFRRETVTSTPAYYSIMLDDYVTFVEMTGTARTGFFRFSHVKEDNVKI